MILSSGMHTFFQQAEMTPSTSIFYDLYLNDNIGHKIVSIMQCKMKDTNKTRIFMQNKMREIVKQYPHLKCRIIKHVWNSMEIDYSKMIICVNKPHNEVINDALNTPLNTDLPGWQVVITTDNCILFICDHTYGDGAYIAHVMRGLFDNDSLNNMPLRSEKKKSIPLLSKILLFFKIIYLIYKRFTILYKPPSAPWGKETICHKQLACLSLKDLKKIRDRFSCSDGTRISINDIIHTLIVKTNSIHFKKNTITSSAMFNMRKDINDNNDQNKLGYILLANKVENDAPPEEVLRDVHDFMQFYKETPSVGIISKFMHWYYAWDKYKACKLMRDLNKSVDFIISNYMFQYKDKHIQRGIEINNMYGTVTPCDASQMYSITTYGDKVNINFTYKKRCIKDITIFERDFFNALDWLEN